MTSAVATRAAPEVAVDGPSVTGEAWIVCLDELRSVTAEGVACPRRPGAPVSLATCLDCRLLITLSAERTGVGWWVVEDSA